MAKTEDDAIKNHTAIGGAGDAPDATAAAEAAALATREAPTGVKAAVEVLRDRFDEGAHVIWETGGPRNSHIEKIAGVLTEIEGGRRMVIVTAFSSGAYKLYGEAIGKHPDIQADFLSAAYLSE